MDIYVKLILNSFTIDEVGGGGGSGGDGSLWDDAILWNDSDIWID